MPPADIFSGLKPSVAVILGAFRRAIQDVRTYQPIQGHRTRERYDVKGPFQTLNNNSSQDRLRPTGPKHFADVQTAKRPGSSGQGSSDLEEADAEGITVKQQWKVDVEAR